MEKGTALLRQQNEKRTLAFLRNRRVSSRLEIAEALGVSKNTVSLIVDKFMKEGIIKQLGIEEQIGAGRPRVQLSLIPDAFKAIGILIRDSQGEYVVTDYFSNTLDKGTFELDTQNTDTCFNSIISLCENLLEKHPEIIGIAIGIPGLVDPNMGYLHYSSHLGWKDVFVKEIMDTKLPVKTRVLNSVKAAALEPLRNIAEDDSSVFYIRIENGVGGAFILGRELYFGASATAGEIGHILVKPDGPLCSCGQRGCLEPLINLPAIKKMAFERQVIQELNSDITTLLNSMMAPGKQEIANQIMQECGSHLGIAIANVINLFNPKYIIVDSPFAKIKMFSKSVVDAAEGRALRFPVSQTNFQFIHTDNASARGAALSVFLSFENI